MLTTVEKVILLQDIDLFEFILTEGLSQIALIADELEMTQGQIVFREGELPDAMYIVIDGKIVVTREKKEIMTIDEKNEFGTWGLFDDAPRGITATALSDCRLLRINKEEFIELLSDSPHLTESVLKRIVKRMKKLVDRFMT
ncbi:MAG: cyclic nucleotide-binding domain-containing protein [Candidatus Krumholzibacteria bacterium]|nr:cyclic nucleotide-binding domain-containing protein [Candidatus Krumholzibacteria bacterium]